jgi:hypothetical protein
MEGGFFVLAEGNLQPGDATGRMTWQRPYEKPNGEYMGQTDNVSANALSVFSDVADLHRAREINPWVRKKAIASVEISLADGWLKHTPAALGDSHHDWWTDPYDLIPAATVIEAKWSM